MWHDRDYQGLWLCAFADFVVDRLVLSLAFVLILRLTPVHWATWSIFWYDSVKLAHLWGLRDCLFDIEPYLLSYSVFTSVRVSVRQTWNIELKWDKRQKLASHLFIFRRILRLALCVILRLAFLLLPQCFENIVCIVMHIWGFKYLYEYVYVFTWTVSYTVSHLLSYTVLHTLSCWQMICFGSFLSPSSSSSSSSSHHGGFKRDAFIINQHHSMHPPVFLN